MTSPMSSRSPTTRWRRSRAMTRSTVALATTCAVIALARSAAASSGSAFKHPPAALKAAISSRFACSWRPYLEGSEQCGDELVVINRNDHGTVESVELTCPIEGAPKAIAQCQAEARWILDAFLPSWDGRRRWVDGVFRAPPARNRFVQTKGPQTTVLAEAEGPEDRPLMNIIIGITQGDPDSWDLPRLGSTPSPAPPSPPTGSP